MNLFTRREYFITRRLDELNICKNQLEKKNIKYKVVTNSITNTGRNHGIPFIDSNSAYEYRVYISKKDYNQMKGKK